jgi:hypothetical protein
VNDKRDFRRQSPDPMAEWPFGEHDGMDGAPESGVEEIVQALAAPGSPEELRDEFHYLRLFDVAGPQDGQHLPAGLPEERKSLRTRVIGGRAAAVLAASLVAGVGVAAAYAGTLPRGLQSSAHRFLGAQAPPESSGSAAIVPSSQPTPHPSDSQARRPATPPATTDGTPSVRPTPPDIDGAHGRCTAWSKGGLAATSTSYHRLMADAGGADEINAYCASILEKPPKPTHKKKAPDSPNHPKKSGTTSAKSRSHTAASSAPPGRLRNSPL